MTDDTSATTVATEHTPTDGGAHATEPAVVGVFGTHEAAQSAVSSLARAGYDMRRISIVGKDYRTEERPVGFYNTGDRLKVWGSRGAFWGGLLGLLVSPAFFLIPAVGHVIILGPLTSALVGALEGAAIGGGVSVLGAALASVGVPRDSIVRYEGDIRAGRFVVIVHGTDYSAGRQAERLLRDEGAESVDRY
jgi:hypothetical protein